MGEPWAAIEFDERYEHPTALCTVVVARGDEGGSYIDRLSVMVADRVSPDSLPSPGSRASLLGRTAQLGVI